MDAQSLAIFIMGPTAAGKTALAVELVQRLPCEIISVDSAMVYRGMDIGTAKPDAAIRALARHRLIDIRDPGEPYSAAAFCRDALREMTDIASHGRIPLLVGGTMLYFRALEEGLSELPGADPEVRAWIEDQARQQGWPALHRRLGELDPSAARRIHPNDPQRIQRALEVHQLSGQPLSSLQQKTKRHAHGYRFRKFALTVESRDELHRRIEQRLAGMLGNGFFEEVQGLYRRGDLHMGLPAVRAVGYRQFWEHLAGKVSYEEAVSRTLFATRQYAKRQLTWLRRQKAVSRLGDKQGKSIKYIMQAIEKENIDNPYTQVC